MTKKFITIQQNNMYYRVHLQDLRGAFKKNTRNTPKIPLFTNTSRHNIDEDTEESLSMSPIK